MFSWFVMVGSAAFIEVVAHVEGVSCCSIVGNTGFIVS